jgi:ADP-heptose:LPS heptosyltransferase
MHIAYAVGVASIVLFGPTCEIKNAPAGKGVALSVDMACRPCQYTDLIETCPEACCMKELTAEIVMNKAEEMLSAR